jgi:FKBP-type peptidyl-prolyl cis-trans isomerase
MAMTSLPHRAALLAVTLGLSTLASCARSDPSTSAEAGVSPSAGASSSPPSTASPSTPSSSAPSPSASGAAATDAGVAITVLSEGFGPPCEMGDHVMIHYTVTLLDGSPVASSRERKKPLELTVGERRTIMGLSQGIAGMRRHEKRKLVVPPELAFGAKSNAKIPPNSTLVYEVELLAIRDK